VLRTHVSLNSPLTHKEMQSELAPYNYPALNDL